MFNYECLADVVETQNFASLRVGDVILCLGRFCCVPLLSALVGYRVSFLPALASPRFRLARQSLPFSLVRWLSGKRAVFGRGGRPNGMVQLLVVSVCAGGLR